MVKRYALLASAAAATSPAVSGNSPEESQKPDHSHHKYMWGAIIIVVFSILVGFSLFLCIWRKVLPIFKHRLSLTKGRLKAESLMLRRFQLEEIERATKNFSEDCLLGSGAFGSVYKGTFEKGGTLAIKRAHDAASYQLSIEEFRNEVRLLSKVKHRNLVGLVGFCEEVGAKGAKVLVYEYVPHGSLLDYIMGRGGKSLTWRQRVNIAIGAAKGIAHLHDGVTPSIIHRDIKPSNILVGDGYEAKVADFGLVKMGPVGDQSHVSSQIKGTPGYLDPAYCSSFHLSPFSDVYSFGVILLQLVSARPAVDTTRNQSNYHIIEWARPGTESGNIEEILDASLLSEPCNKEIMLKMAQLGLRCVVKTPKQRPTMKQVWQELEDALYAADNFVHKLDFTSMDSRRSIAGSRHSIDQQGSRRSMDDYNDYSQSFVSVDGVRFQRFQIEMDSQSFQTRSFRYFETASFSIEVDKNNLRGISEERSREEDFS